MPLDIDGLDGALRPEGSGRAIEPPPLPPLPPVEDPVPGEMTPTRRRVDLAPTMIRRPRRSAPVTLLALGLAAAVALVWWLRPREHALPAAAINTAAPAASNTAAPAASNPAAPAAATAPTPAKLPIVAAAPSLAPPPPLPLDLVLPARFAFNDDTPRGDADALAGIAARCLGEIVLVGHSDWIGTERANREVGRARAAAVRAIFVARGIDAARLRVGSAGSHAPIARNDSAAGRRQNRRVTLSCATNPGGNP
jgi:OOP family OmpA-OmpF porin